MKNLILAFLVVVSTCAYADYYPENHSRSSVIQIKYSPWGGIDADEDELDSLEPADDDYSKYDLTFARSYSGRIIIEPFYLSMQRSTAELDSDMPDAEVTTFAVGFAGIHFDPFESPGTYLMGGLGVGQGTFKFKDPALDDDELLFEANGEIGFHFNRRLLLGAGIDFQHFGKFRESIASSWTFYFATGLVF